MDRPPVHELSAVNCYSLRFKCRATVATLHRWMEEARKTGIHSLVRFVRTLKQDLSAVESAVREPWSNGPVEGQLNRLKMLKRQMYGRAGIELLRARLLPEPAFSGP